MSASSNTPVSDVISGPVGHPGISLVEIDAVAAVSVVEATSCAVPSAAEQICKDVSATAPEIRAILNK